MAPIHHQFSNAPHKTLIMKDSQGNARARARTSSPLVIYATSAENITNSPLEVAPRIEIGAPQKATVHHAKRPSRQSNQPQGGQLRVACSNPYPRFMASDHDPRCFPFYSGQNGVKQAYNFRDSSCGNTGISQNKLRGQVYQAYAPNPSSDQLAPVMGYHRTDGCLNDVQHPGYHTRRAHRQYYSDPDLNDDRAALRGFSILADNYQLGHGPHVKAARSNYDISHPHVLRMGELNHRHANMALPEAIPEPQLTGRARLQQSFKTRRRVRETRSTIY